MKSAIQNDPLAKDQVILRTIFDAVNVGMLLIDEKGAVKRVNHTVARWIGKEHLAAPEVQPGDLLGCVHALSDAAGCGHTAHCASCPIRGTFESALRGGQPVRGVETEASLRVNGKEATLWLEVSADPLVVDGKRHVLLALSDITERKRAEAERARLASFPERNPIPIIEAALDGHLTYVNPAAGKLFPDLKQKELHHPWLANWKTVTGDCLREPTRTWDREVAIGDRHFHQSLFYSADTGCIRIYGLDITDRKRHEEGLRAIQSELEKRVGERTAELARTVDELQGEISRRSLAEEKARASSLYARGLLEASLDPLVTISPEGKVTDVNKATEEAAGLPRERLIGTDFSGYFTEPEKAAEGYHRVLLEGSVRDFPLTLRHSSGRTMDVLYNASLYRNEAGEVVGVFAAARDVTQLKRMEQGLRAASLYARGLIEASLDPLVTISPDGKVTDVNKATEEAAGLPRERLIGTDFSGYFTEPEKAAEGYRKVFSDGFVQDYPLTLRNSAGKTMDVLYNAALYRNANGEVQGIFAAARDVTERKRVEKELDNYRRNLEELVKQRTAELEQAVSKLAQSNEDLRHFAYVASHDLQEPLRVVTGYLQLLERRYKDKLDSDADKFINFAVDAAAYMEQLINDLLAYSRVSSAAKPFAPTHMQAVLDRVRGILRHAIAESGAVITSEPLPTVTADETQMTQVLQNLIANAIKFRSDRAPEIHVSASRAGEKWVFAVRDNGIGIAKQYWDQIFVIFQRLHSRQKYKGTGIGLAICKRIVERHGGRIWLDSTPGEGTIFFFSI